MPGEVPTHSTNTVTGCYLKELTDGAEKASLGLELRVPTGGSSTLLASCLVGVWSQGLTKGYFLSLSPLLRFLQMEVIVGDFGIVVVPRDAADTDRIMNHSSILRKYKVSPPAPCWCSNVMWPFSEKPGGWRHEDTKGV